MNKHNILLLTIDCFRFDRLGTNGYERNITPNLDTFANEEAINFKQTIAGGPSTMAAFPCLFTSSYPVMYGGTWYLSEDRTTIAQVLRQEGYETIGISSNPYISPEFGYDRGFTIFWDSVKRTRKRDRKITLLSKIINRDSTLWSMLRKMARSGEIRSRKGLYPSASAINGKIVDTISKGGEKPFFIWAHYMDLHYPYNLANLNLSAFLEEEPSSNYLSDVLSKLMKEPSKLSEQDKELVTAIYDASLNYVDRQLGKLFRSLQELRIWDNLVIIITADHGEELLEEGRFGHGDEEKETSFSEELIHIPFILKLPGGVYAGTCVDRLVSQVDIAPTILDILRVEKPANWYGVSTIPLLEGTRHQIRQEAITQRGIERSFAMCWRTEQWKFVHNAFTGEERLYEVGKKSSSEEDVSHIYQNVVGELREAVIEHLRSHEKVYSKERLANIEIDGELKKQLEDLGYL